MPSLKSTLRTHTTYSLREALRALVQELRAARRHRRATRQARAFRGRRGLKLNVGCGENLKSGWVNIDAGYDSTLQLDVREPLPFDSGSVSVVYSEHLFEHLDYPLEAQKFLGESFRVLEPGGVFSLGLPDFEAFINAYSSRDQHFYRDLFQFKQPEWVRATPMHVTNWILRAYGHKYAYDFETLSMVLREAGFVDVVRRDFDAMLDSESRRWGTLYAQARKPDKPDGAVAAGTAAQSSVVGRVP